MAGVSTSPVKDAPAFDFYPERWLAGVAAFSDAEQLAYVRLLCHQWLTDPQQGLPDDMPALKRLGGKGVTPALLEKFPICDDGRRRNARLEKIRTEQRERIAKRRAGASKTNRKRWGERVASDIVSESPPPTTHPLREKERAGEDWPEKIRASYPPTTHQADAFQAITASILKGHAPELILQGTRECAAIIRAAEASAGGPIRWVPNPKNFFADEVWMEPLRLAENLKPKAQPKELNQKPVTMQL